MTMIAIRVDEKLKEEATKLYKDLGLDMPTAIKMFLKQSVLTRSIPFDIRLDSDFSLELNSGDYVRTRDIIEYNQETQEAYEDYMKK